MMEILECGIAVISGDTHHREWIKQKGKLVHDEWFAAEICKHIKPGDWVVEGGANIGTITRALLDAGAKVQPFEPDGRASECLAYNCPGLPIYWMGLSDEKKNVSLVRSENAGATFCIDIPGNIQVVSLDAIMKVSTEDRFIKLIKLDIEGYEVKALRGARETIARCKPVLIIEVNKFALERAGDSDDALFALIESYGYTWKIMQPGCERGCPQYDVECLPKQKA